MTLIEQLRSKKKALTVEELAGLLCVAVRTLYKEVEDDHIPFFRVRTSIRFDPHQVADWLEMKMPSHSVRTQRQSESSCSRLGVVVEVELARFVHAGYLLSHGIASLRA